MVRLGRIAVFDFQYSEEFYTALETYSGAPLLRLSDESLASTEDTAGIDALVCSWKNALDARVLIEFPQLRYIATRATSTKNIDLNYTNSRKILVENIGSYGDQATAEFVVQQILSLAHDHQDQELRTEVSQKSMGFLGFGHVATRVAPALQALGMKTAYYTPSEQISRNSRHGTPFADKQTVLRSDFLSIHTPDGVQAITAEDLKCIPRATGIVVTTLGLPFNEAVFRKWKKNAPNSVIMDKVAAGDLDFSELEGISVRNVFAARTQESKRSAEHQVLNNVRTFTHTRAHSLG